MPSTVKLLDLSPKWLRFYELAKDEPDPERRWQLWHEHYRFAAIPPTPAGLERAREMLDGSFDRYPTALDAIAAGAPGFRPQPQASLEAVCRALNFDGDMTVECVLYVGNFEGNAFAYTMNGVARVHFPVETHEQRDITMAHEFAHVVHERLCGAEGYVTPIAVLAMKEGIAMHTAKAVAPGEPDVMYISHLEPAWMERCQAKHRAILEGIQPFLSEASEAAMWRFTMGTGTTGEGREVYYVGWHVVGHLLRQGRTLGELARLGESEILATVQATVGALLRG
ncbi:MAG: hypothetical protein K0R39_289 [Symbiobacteriaceae bacterium]|jgi:hypothetical protein|nr:hypothetical protein [Symbiobacteriaceae bacterium]